jgi:hypothetical protein
MPLLAACQLNVRWPSRDQSKSEISPDSKFVILPLAKMLTGANAFEITETALAKRSDVTMLHWVENGWMEFSGSTGAQQPDLEDTTWPATQQVGGSP